MLSKLRARLKRPVRFTTTLRDVREREGLSVEELAEYCQASPETIMMIEEAKYEPSVVLAEHLARRLNTSVEELFVANAVVALRSANQEERIAWQTNRYLMVASYLFVALLLFGANLLIQISGYEEYGFILAGAWAVFTLLILGFSSRVRGQYSLMRELNRRGTTGKVRVLKVAIGSIVGALIYATLLHYWHGNERSTNEEIYNVLFFLIFSSLFSYWFEYRRVKKKPTI